MDTQKLEKAYCSFCRKFKAVIKCYNLGNSKMREKKMVFSIEKLGRFDKRIQFSACVKCLSLLKFTYPNFWSQFLNSCVEGAETYFGEEFRDLLLKQVNKVSGKLSNRPLYKKQLEKWRIQL